MVKIFWWLIKCHEDQCVLIFGKSIETNFLCVGKDGVK